MTRLLTARCPSTIEAPDLDEIPVDDARGLDVNVVAVAGFDDPVLDDRGRVVVDHQLIDP